MPAITRSCGSLWKKTRFGSNRIRKLAPDLLFSSHQKSSLRPELHVILARCKPVRRRPVFGQGSGVDNPPVGSRCESGPLECGNVLVGAEQMQRNVDMLGPVMAVYVFFV